MNNHMFRIILTFRGPQPNELKYLTSLLSRAKSIERQDLYIAQPDTQLLFVSSNPAINMKAVEVLSQKDWSMDVLKELDSLYHKKK